MFYFFKKNKDNLKLRKLVNHTNSHAFMRMRWKIHEAPKCIYLLNLDFRILPKLSL